MMLQGSGMNSFYPSVMENDSKLFPISVDNSNNNNKNNNYNNDKGLRISICNDVDETENEQTVKRMLEELEHLKSEERDRLLNKHLKDTDLQQKKLLKIHIFLFGRKEGKEFFNELCRQQKVLGFL